MKVTPHRLQGRKYRLTLGIVRRAHIAPIIRVHRIILKLYTLRGCRDAYRFSREQRHVSRRVVGKPSTHVDRRRNEK